MMLEKNLVQNSPLVLRQTVSKRLIMLLMVCLGYYWYDWRRAVGDVGCLVSLLNVS